MGTLIPLSPALKALADNDTQKFADNLTIAFSVTVIGLLIGGLAFLISMVRDRIYSQDISDLEYLLELLEGNAPRLHAGMDSHGKGAAAEDDEDGADEGDEPESDAAADAEAAAGVTSAATMVIPPAPPRDVPAPTPADEVEKSVAVDEAPAAAAAGGEDAVPPPTELAAEER
jgi:hypothetical protein